MQVLANEQRRLKTVDSVLFYAVLWDCWAPAAYVYRGRNFKLLRSPRIDSKKLFPRQAVWPGGPVRQPYSYSVPSPHRLFKNSSTVQCAENQKDGWDSRVQGFYGPEMAFGGWGGGGVLCYAKAEAKYVLRSKSTLCLRNVSDSHKL